MAGFIAKQPNGLYCRHSSITDCITDYNMTAEDYIELCKERAEEEARDVLKNYIKPFSWVKDYFYPNNMSQEEFERILQEMEQEPKQDPEQDPEEKSISIVDLEKNEDASCLVCGNRQTPTRHLRIKRERGDSIISFNICKDCLWRLSFAIRDAVDSFAENEDRKEK